MTEGFSSPLRVFILCGFPFAGKSTVARALAVRLNLVHVEVDQAVRESCEYTPGALIPRSAWISAYRVSYRRMEESLAAGRSVILDATNYRLLHRDLIRSKAARYEAETTVVWMETTISEIQARRERNRATPSRPDVGEDDFTLVLRDMQPPAPDESTIRFMAAADVETLVARLMSVRNNDARLGDPATRTAESA